MELIPQPLSEFLQDQPKLKAVKTAYGYEIRCKQCKEALWLKSVSYEAGTFNFEEGTFTNGDLEITNTDLDLRCGCAGESYAPPEDFEIQW